MKSVGFKEWSVVCEALGRGLQSIILRKGGIAEGRAGFSFQQREFFLFPTHFHEQLEKVRQIDIGVPEQDQSEIDLKYFSRIEEIAGNQVVARSGGAGIPSYFAARSGAGTI